MKTPATVIELIKLLKLFELNIEKDQFIHNNLFDLDCDEVDDASNLLQCLIYTLDFLLHVLLFSTSSSTTKEKEVILANINTLNESGYTVLLNGKKDGSRGTIKTLNCFIIL